MWQSRDLASAYVLRRPATTCPRFRRGDRGVDQRLLKPTGPEGKLKGRGTKEQMDEQLDRRLDGPTGGWADGWTGGQADE